MELEMRVKTLEKTVYKHGIFLWGKYKHNAYSHYMDEIDRLKSENAELKERVSPLDTFDRAAVRRFAWLEEQKVKLEAEVVALKEENSEYLQDNMDTITERNQARIERAELKDKLDRIKSALGDGSFHRIDYVQFVGAVSLILDEGE